MIYNIKSTDCAIQDCALLNITHIQAHFVYMSSILYIFIYLLRNKKWWHYIWHVHLESFSAVKNE